MGEENNSEGASPDFSEQRPKSEDRLEDIVDGSQIPDPVLVPRPEPTAQVGAPAAEQAAEMPAHEGSETTEPTEPTETVHTPSRLRGCVSLGGRSFVVTARGVYHFGPAAVPIIAGGAAYFWRHDGAAAIQSVLDIFPSLKATLGVDDRGLEIEQTAQDVASINSALDVERELGGQVPDLRATQLVDEAVGIMEAIGRDYSSASRRYERAASEIRTRTTRFATDIGNLIMAPIEATARLTQLDGVLRDIQDYNGWEAYTNARPYLDSQTQATMDDLRSQNVRWSDAMTILRGRRNAESQRIRHDRVNNGDDALIDSYQRWLDNVNETHNLQSSVADLTNGYGRVIRQALRDYQRARTAEDRQAAITRLQQSIDNNEDLAALVQSIESRQGTLSAEHARIQSFVGRLRSLTQEVEDPVERLRALRDIYEEVGALRDDYSTVGRSFTPDQQAQAIATIDSRLALAQQRTNTEILTAGANPKYTAQNPELPELHGIDQPSKAAYQIYGVAAGALVAALALGAGWIYLKRTGRSVRDWILRRDRDAQSS